MAIVRKARGLFADRDSWRRLSTRLPLPEGRVARFMFELSLLLPAYMAYHLVRGAVDGRVDAAFANASKLIHVEKVLGIFWEVPLQGLILNHDMLVGFFNGVYIWGHIPVVAALAIWIFAFRRDVFARYRNAFLISGAIGLVFYITLPVAPPRFLPGAGFVDTVTVHDYAYRALQHPAFVNQYAALPSLHLGWNLLVAAAVFQTTRSWFARGFALMLPTLMLGGIILTANHYILDAVLGVAVAVAALWIAGWLNRQFIGTRLHAVLV